MGGLKRRSSDSTTGTDQLSVRSVAIIVNPNGVQLLMRKVIKHPHLVHQINQGLEKMGTTNGMISTGCKTLLIFDDGSPIKSVEKLESVSNSNQSSEGL